MSRPDLEALLKTLLPFAQQMIAKHGRFYPFGACMKQDGEVEPVAAHADDEHPKTEELLRLLQASLRQRAEAGQIRAAATCANLVIALGGRETNAIRMSLEHSDGEAIDAYVPYRKRFLVGTRYSELVAAKGYPPIFVPAKDMPPADSQPPLP